MVLQVLLFMLLQKLLVDSIIIYTCLIFLVEYIMKYTENVLNILALKQYKGIGNSWISKNIKGNETVNYIVELLNNKNNITNIQEFLDVKHLVQAELSTIIPYIDGAIAIGDKEFPNFRGNVKESERPVVLFYRGNIDLLHKNNKNIAVIGVLKPDEYTEYFEKKVVDYLINQNYTIVSGLALGCDSIAHIQALKSKGNTIAILPSSLDEILPASNKYLAENIVANNGLLVTEYYTKAKYKELNSRYVERDRLQALFSDGIILSASYAKNDLGNDSGSRHAMNYAKSYSIKRAVLEPVDNNIMYDLNRQILHEDDKVICIKYNEIKETVDKFLNIKNNQPMYKQLDLSSFLS